MLLLGDSTYVEPRTRDAGRSAPGAETTRAIARRGAARRDPHCIPGDSDSVGAYCASLEVFPEEHPREIWGAARNFDGWPSAAVKITTIRSWRGPVRAAAHVAARGPVPHWVGLPVLDSNELPNGTQRPFHSRLRFMSSGTGSAPGLVVARTRNACVACGKIGSAYKVVKPITPDKKVYLCSGVNVQKQGLFFATRVTENPDFPGMICASHELHHGGEITAPCGIRAFLWASRTQPPQAAARRALPRRDRDDPITILAMRYARQCICSGSSNPPRHPCHSTRIRRRIGAGRLGVAPPSRPRM